MINERDAVISDHLNENFNWDWLFFFTKDIDGWPPLCSVYWNSVLFCSVLLLLLIDCPYFCFSLNIFCATSIDFLNRIQTCIGVRSKQSQLLIYNYNHSQLMQFMNIKIHHSMFFLIAILLYYYYYYSVDARH